MRVLIDYRPALRARTGVGEWTHKLVEALAGIESPGGTLSLTVFSSSWKDRLAATLPAGVGAIDRRIPVSVLNYCWHQLEWPPVEMVTGAAFDVVHSPHPLLIPTRSAAQVVTIHDLDFLDHPHRADAEIQRDYPALVSRHAQRAAHVIVPSENTATRVADRLGVSRDAITVCSNGPPGWSPRAEAPPKGHLLFVGAIAPRKNVDTLLDAYARLLRQHPDAPPLVLAGPPGPQAGPTMARLEVSPLAGRVRCTGYLDKDALRQYYYDARLLVLPSHDEGFGLPALEAMSVGVPVVVSDRGALPEVVGDAGIVIDPTQPELLTNAMARILSDADLAQTLAKKGLRQAAHYSWERSAARLAEAYAKAVTIHACA